jgi:putative endopeptidase
MKTRKRKYQTNHSLNNVSKKNIKKYKDTVYELRNDYYSYINYPWIESHTSPKDHNDKNMFNYLMLKTNRNMKNVVIKSLFEEKTKEAKNVQNIYKSYNKWNDKLVKQQFINMLNILTDFLESDKDKNKQLEIKHFYNFLGWLTINDIDNPIKLEIINDAKNPLYYIPNIQEGGLTFDFSNFYKSNDEIHKRERKLFIKYLDDIFKEFFGSDYKNTYDIEDILKIEKEINNYTMDIEESIYIEKTYHKYNLYKSKAECNFNTKIYFESIGMNNVNSNELYIIIDNPCYLKNIMKILMIHWNTKQWKSYWVYQLLKVFVKFHSKLNKIYVKYFTELINLPRLLKNDIAIHNTEIIMNTTISKKYLEYFKNEKARIFCLDMIERTKKVLRERLTNNNWLKPKTIENALLKLEKMNFVVGYKKKWQYDPYCNFIEDDAYGNYIKYVNWNTKKNINNSYKKVPPKDVWIKEEDQNVFDVNAYYDNVENELIIPNAILDYPFVDLKKNIAYNLAHIGTTIGHEMIHAFDSDGCKYDENGKYKNWWTEEDIKVYEKKLESVEKQYHDFAKRDGYNILTKLTIGENIADICGFLLTEDVLNEYLIEKGIYGMKQDEYFKEFYVNFARQWRSTLKVSYLKKIDNNDVHTIAKYRVNCVLSRSRRFQRIFNIKRDDKMYYPITLEEMIW